MSNMALIWCFMLLSLLNLAVASLWKDHSDLYDDVDRLVGGENLVYFSYGDMGHNSVSINKAISGFNIKGSNVACFNAVENNTISQQLADLGKTSMIERRLAVISGVESILPSQMRALDFIYRITDRSVSLANIIILLTFNTEVSKLSGIIDEQSWRETLATHVNSDELHINGEALTGRIGRASVQLISDPASENSNEILLQEQPFSNIYDYCTSLTVGSDNSSARDLGEAKLDFMSFLALLSIPLIMYYINKRASQQMSQLKAIEVQQAERLKQQQHQGGAQSSDSAMNEHKTGSTASLRAPASSTAGGGGGGGSTKQSSRNFKKLMNTHPHRATLSISTTDTDANGDREDNNEDDTLPVMIPASGNSPTVFDNALFRAEYRSNHGANAAQHVHVASRSRASSAAGSFNGSYTSNHKSSSRHHHHNSNDGESDVSPGPFSTGNTHSRAKSRSTSSEKVYTEDDRDENGEGGDENNEIIIPMSGFKGRLSYGSARLSGNLSDPHLNHHEDDDQAMDSPAVDAEAAAAARLIRIDINESILPVKRRGRKSASSITKPTSSFVSDRVTRSSGHHNTRSGRSVSHTDTTESAYGRGEAAVAVKTRGRAKSSTAHQGTV